MNARLSPVAAFGVAALGIALFSVMDGLMKGLTLTIGAYNALLWRNFAAVAISGALYAWKREGGWPERPVLRLHLLRGSLSAGMAVLFFWGLGRVPLAQGVALSFIAPILALFLAALLLGEHIGRATIAASLLAFAGVVVILAGQARADLGPQALLGSAAILLSAMCYAWNIVLMRQQALIAGPVEVAFFQNLFMGGCILLAAPWFAVVPDIGHAPALVGSAVLATGSLLLLSWAYSHAEANYLAPVEFTAFIWATLLGWLLFAERVSGFTVIGAAMIVAGCVISARGRKGPPVHVETANI